MVWLLGAALVLNLALIGALLGLVAIEGMKAFWPRAVQEIAITEGDAFLGMPVRTESFEVSVGQRREFLASLDAGEIPPGSVTSEGDPVRRLFRVGNRDLGQEPFRWVELSEIDSVGSPPESVFVERTEWGVFMGVPEAIVVQDLTPASIDDAGEPMLDGPAEDTVAETNAEMRVTREIRWVELAPGDVQPFVLTRRYETVGAQATWARLREMLPEAVERRDEMARVQRHRIGPINAAMTGLRERAAQAEIAFERAENTSRLVGWVVWVLAFMGAVGFVAGALWVRARASTRARTTRDRLVMRVCWPVAAGLALFALLEVPLGNVDVQDLADVRSQLETRQHELEADYAQWETELRDIRDEDDRFRVVIRDPGTGRFAPERQASPDEPMRISQIVRIYQPNELTFGDKLGIYFSRWWEFLTDDPREANTEGGVFPVVFGTVLLTILLTIVVVPLGVLAALYLREYAKQGFVTSVIRIAVNNLAGVPSIVYGVFGLGFFCYTVGSYIDHGPGESTALPRFDWWFLVAAGVGVTALATSLGLLGVRQPGQSDTRLTKTLRIVSVVAWVGALCLVAAMFVTTPYFHGFFEARLPDPTFGKRGLLWASLTLALLTLPVVIVSTEEAIAAVQPSLREGSYGCGASKWQTIRRIVLPGAMPGILTGMILAMARGAGEVAPLMLVGALKWAPELPVSLEAPFVHLDRSFMHLGFHIFDLGFQSPDSEAARSLVWASTLLLIAVILLLNLAAIALRARVRRKMGSGHF